MLKALLVAALLCFADVASAQLWTHETVGQDVSAVDFVIDGLGALHVLYMDYGNAAAPELIYAHNPGGAWQYDTLPVVPEPGLVSIAVDAFDAPHVAFVDSSQTVHYAFLSGGTWNLEPLPPLANGVPYHPSLALDGSDEPHIAFLTYGERIRYAHKVGGIWTDEEVNGSFLDISNSRVAMAIHPSGSLHIGAWEYFDGAAFFTRGASTWSHDNFGEWGYRPWVVMDAAGHAHFVFSGGGTHYATNRDGVWETETVELESPPDANGIAIDTDGVPGLTYSVTEALYYQEPDIHFQTHVYFAYRIGDDVWQREVVDVAPDFAGPYYVPSRIQFDANDIPHVLYRYPATGELRHASRDFATAADGVPRAGGAWIESIAPNPFNPSVGVSFHLAEAGPIRLTIYDLAGREIRTLFDGFRAAGTHVERWDGRDARKRSVSSGVYFVRMATAGRDVTRKLTLVR